ncbi:MAG: rod shape-determining protein MreC [Candidatus Kerfeldbacteria bacterium]|nr:rod shape-determining protein MreC [Candidatus Kerfeldbacteria bacterium]
MKTRYIRPNVFTLTALMIVFLWLVGGRLEWSAGLLLRPATKAVGTVRRWLVMPADVAALRHERDALQQQLLAVSQQLAEARGRLEVAANLSQLAEFLDQANISSITASVIAYSPDPGVQSIAIQRGRRHGVTEGLAVVASDGTMVGTVARVHNQTATVRLLTDGQSRVLAKVGNQSSSRGLIRGERGLTMIMEFIPKNDRLGPGQIVATSDLDPRIPPDLLIGTVEHVQLQPGALFQSARVRSATTFNRLGLVAVVKPHL